MSDLKLDRKLLNNDFNGYKLANQPLNIGSLPLICPVNGTTRNPDQFSLAYIQSHELHNHLYYDQFSGSVYFTDQNGDVNGLPIKLVNDKIPPFVKVLHIPKLKSNYKSSFSDSILFPSEQLVVVCDGNGFIYVADSGIRDQCSREWRIITDSPVYDLNCPSLLISAHIVNSLLHVVTMSLKEVKNTGSTSTKVILHWLQIGVSLENLSECAVQGARVFSGQSVLKAHWFSHDYTYLVLMADNPFALVDSKTFAKIEPLQPQNSKDDKSHYSYKWHQSKELISLTFNIHVTEKETQCEFAFNKISVKLTNGKVLLEGNLEKEIVTDASKWFVDENRLEVVLVKKNTNEFWNNVVINDEHGVHEILGEEEERINEVHESLAHLTSDGETKSPADAHHFNMQQLEECDMEESEMKLYSINVFTGKVDVLKNLSGHQLLFVQQFDPAEPPLICLRHDVDGVLWKPNSDIYISWKHLFTFDALGYVQASKLEHKFTKCDSELKNVCITDCTSHVYLYEGSSSSKLQHKQYVCSFANCEKILGCHLAKEHLCVLTDKHINFVKLP